MSAPGGWEHKSGLTRLPRAALPPGALIVVFSPLLDPRLIEALRDLRERGFSVLVVDVLNAEPAHDGEQDCPGSLPGPGGLSSKRSGSRSRRSACRSCTGTAPAAWTSRSPRTPGACWWPPDDRHHGSSAAGRAQRAVPCQRSGRSCSAGGRLSSAGRRFRCRRSVGMRLALAVAIVAGVMSVAQLGCRRHYSARD